MLTWCYPQVLSSSIMALGFRVLDSNSTRGQMALC